MPEIGTGGNEYRAAIGSVNMDRLDGKVAVVTGGGGGIGGATCRRFSNEGAKVAVLDVDLKAAQAVAASLQNSKCIYFKCTNVRVA